MGKVHVTIDGIQVYVPDNYTVLEAAKEINIHIPTLCFLKDMGDFAAFNAVYAKYFTGKPARSCVAVSALPKNVLVEVEVIAEV